MSQLGRQVSYGLGKGADVAATNWIPQLKFDLNPDVKYADNTSAFGVVERTNSATPVQQSAKGTLEAKLTSDSTGLILLGAFGSVASTDNADTNPIVKDHTFTINQDILGQPLTLVRKDAVATEKFTNARIGKWELNLALNNYITFNAEVMAKVGTTTTATPAYTLETEFVAKHFTIKSAANLAGLAGASNITNVEDFSLTMDPNLTPDWFAGSLDPASFSSGGFDLKFQMTTRYNDTTFKAAYLAGTTLAWQITVKNTDVIIGAAANPGLVITCPSVSITDWARTEDQDKPMSQKMTGSIHFSPADAYALKAVLTNSTPSY